MKRTMITAVAALLIAVLTATVYAQPGPGGPGGPGGRPGGPGMGRDMSPGMILRNEEIKNRLALTEEQVASLTKLADEMRDQRGGMSQRGQRGQRGQGGPGGPGGPGAPPSREDMERFRAEMQKRQTETREKINAILTPEQQEKFKVLAFQMAGGLESPFLNADMLGVVNLTAEQKEKIKAIEAERTAEFERGMEGRQNERERIREMTAEERRAFFEQRRTEGEARNKKYAEKISGVLTDEQKAKATQLTEEGKSLRPQRGPRGNGPPEEGYRPGADSWQPGQGNPNRQGPPPGRGGRRAFPKAEAE